MSNIDTINVGGLDYSIEDTTARGQATSAITISAYVENGNTASRAYSVVGTPINWKGSLYYTTATIAQGATLAAGTNLAAAINIGKMLSNIKTYVGSDEKLHFVDATGADSVLPFNGTNLPNPLIIPLTAGAEALGVTFLHIPYSIYSQYKYIRYTTTSYSVPSIKEFGYTNSVSQSMPSSKWPLSTTNQSITGTLAYMIITIHATNWNGVGLNLVFSN